MKSGAPISVMALLVLFSANASETSAPTRPAPEASTGWQPLAANTGRDHPRINQDRRSGGQRPPPRPDRAARPRQIMQDRNVACCVRQAQRKRLQRPRKPAEIGFARHEPSRHSAGVPFDFVPVASLDAIGRARPDVGAFRKVFGGEHQSVFVYTQQATHAGHHFHARMFAPSFGIAEDPATGSAVAAFAGVLMQFEPLGDGEHSFVVEQGYEMGRPSEISLQIVIRDGALASIEIGGGAVVVSEGSLRL